MNRKNFSVVANAQHLHLSEGAAASYVRTTYRVVNTNTGTVLCERGSYDEAKARADELENAYAKP